MGKGHGSEPMSAAWHSRQSGQVASHPLSLSHGSGGVHRELLFEGFSLAGEGFDPEVTVCQISILKAARRRCLAEPFGPSLLFLPSGTRGSSSDALPSTGASSSMGLHRRVRGGSLD